LVVVVVVEHQHFPRTDVKAVGLVVDIARDLLTTAVDREGSLAKMEKQRLSTSELLAVPILILELREQERTLAERGGRGRGEARLSRDDTRRNQKWSGEGEVRWEAQRHDDTVQKETTRCSLLRRVTVLRESEA
ncbi:hypothetical protein CRG98_030741, partial [Punica granatum]